MNKFAIHCPEQVTGYIYTLLRFSLQRENNGLNQPGGGMDWQCFLTRVFSEGVDGILYYALQRSGNSELLPSGVWNELKQNYLRNCGRNLLITHDLGEILKNAAQENIALLLLRGADLIHNVYPSLGMRAMSDIDLVVRKEDFPALKLLFERAGYAHPKGYPYLFSRNGIFFDIHIESAGFWRAGSWPKAMAITNSAVWEQARSSGPAASTTRTLGSADAVIAGCAHAQEHSFSRIVWLYDVCLLIKREGESFSWENLLERAEQFGLLQPLVFVLRFLQERQLLSIPAAVRTRLEQCRLDAFARKSLTMLLADKRAALSGELLYLFSIRGFRKQVCCAWQTVFLKREVFPLAEENITGWHYLRRFGRITGYSIKKLTDALRA